MKAKKCVIFLVFIVFIQLIFSGCGESVSKEQEFVNLLTNQNLDNADIVMVKKTFVPDSLRSAMVDWIKETVRAASYHMTGGDYEDPEDVIEQAEETANRLFSRTFEYEGLRMYNRRESPKDVAYVDLTGGQKEIFDYLKNKK